MAVIIQFRRDTDANWSSTNPVLANGEMGINTTTNQFKIGNGSTAWNSLSYAPISGTVASLDAVEDVTITSAASGDFLKWNGSAWVNDPINLATDTVGNYMVDISAGTGLSVTHTQGEGSTATVGIANTAVTAGSYTLANITVDAQGRLTSASSSTYDDASNILANAIFN